MEQFGLRSPIGPIPLTAINVSASVSTFTAEVVIEQHFCNDSDSTYEVSYKFPLDNGCAVFRFDAFINGKNLTGKVEEKTKAEQTYSDAISSGKGAYMLTKESDDIFSMNIGNLPPKQSVIIKIGYVTQLAVQDDSVIFALIHNIFPDYKKDIQFEAQLRMAFPIVSIKSMTSGKLINFSHVNNNKKSAVISSKQSGIKFTKEQLVLCIKLEEPHQPCIFTEVAPSLNSRAYALHFFPHTAYRECTAELIFVLDRSGSMGGAPIEMVKQTMYQVLKHMPNTSTFNIVGFGGRFDFLFSEALPCNAGSIMKARKHISTLSADMGGTELHPPLEAIFKKPIPETSLGDDGKPQRIVFVLTDGAISNKPKVFELVEKNSGLSRVFAFGIGNAVDHQLVTGLAQAGKGQSRFIYNTVDMEANVISMLHLAVEPAHEEVMITWYARDGATLSAADVSQAPVKPPPIFNKQLYTIYGLMDDTSEPISRVTLEAKGKSGEYKFTLECSQITETSESGLLIHRLAAQSLVREIEETIKPTQQEQRKAVELCEKFNIASTYASFVIVEDRVDRVMDTMTLVQLEAPKLEFERSAMFQPSYATSAMRLEEIKNSMMHNIEPLLQRGESIETLMDRSCDLTATSFTFRRNANVLRRRIWWKNVGLVVGILLAILLVVFLISLIVSLIK